MSFFETVKQKWVRVIIILGVIIGLGAVVGGVIHWKYEENYEVTYAKLHPEISNPIYLDLLYLENASELKISPQQAKEILPLIKKMNTANESTKTALLKKVYVQLTPAQYQALLTRRDAQDTYRFKEDGKHSHRREAGDEPRKDFRHHDGFRDGKDLGNVLEQSLSDVVTKMLVERSAGR